MRHHPIPLLDLHWEGYELADDDTHRYLWLWHRYNIRLIAVPKDDPEAMGYDHAWCYPRDPDLVAASVAAWDSDTQDEPTGWHKRPTDPPRRAPRREENPEGNRPRCHHGSLLTEPCRTAVCHDPARRHQEVSRAR
ncbi:hypothetical protein ACWCQE_27695 [Streptomyces sp. NPDC002409]|uniref:hypothetical protein n=1 Tax=Streptomyces misionensis TaxID=67331 RepID=UPI0036CA959C